MSGNVPDRADSDAGLVQIDQEEADAFLLFAGFAGARQAEHVGGVLGEGRPGLLTVDDELIAIGDCLGLEAGQIRAGIRFGISLAPDFLAGANFWQITRALFRGAVADQQRADHLDAQVGCACDTPALLFLNEYQQLCRRQSHAAMLGRPCRRDPALARQFEVPGFDFGPARAP